MSFDEKYSKIYNLVKDEINTLENRLTDEIKLSPFTDCALKKFLTRKTKRIRPLLSFLYLKARNKKIDNAQYEFQTVIEIIHNASLIHDDVIDESLTRRGDATLNTNFGNKIAILTGDYLLSLALKKLNSLNSPQIITMCAQTLENMCQGEINQHFNKFHITTINEYLEKSEQKTARLFQTALCGSMLLSGENDTNDVNEFARNFGIAFQIRDDLLNLTDKSNLKPSQNDIENGIYNAPVIFAGSTSNLDEGIEKTKSLLNNYMVEADKHLNSIEDNQYTQAIRELLEILNDV